ncbi:hypothetical protein FB550_110209 [Neobacillus bataviensis]|uniref:Uncharacterized protein n=1 Tax=Neobacillus bataviensis TaxID=220685 RepID=A0A561D2R0_9BACI|nr:hypothetical protein FB550_110209 [Neobacillus bataviensis]
MSRCGERICFFYEGVGEEGSYFFPTGNKGLATVKIKRNCAHHGKEEVVKVTVKIKRDCAHHGKAEAVTIKIKGNCTHHGKEEAVTVKIKRDCACHG